jgi:para-aminobenzoate N-oxygenase AurF
MIEVPDEEAPVRRESYLALLERLSRQSVLKRYEAYRDVDWDAPEMQIDPADPRWILPAFDALGGTAWYQAQPELLRARIGLYRRTTFMKVGLQFENVLSRGLLQFALSRPESSLEQRYAYHELIEESHHSMMFAEFIRRTGFAVPGMTGPLTLLFNRVARAGATFPELFFVFVLGGEDPIDHVQRMAMQNGEEMHPLGRRISQIHITEEARHLCFARNFLREHVPKLSPTRRLILATLSPVILRIVAELMMRPSPSLIREFDIPPHVVDEVRGNQQYRQATLQSLDKVRTLMADLDLVRPRWWRMLGAAA